MEGGWSGGRAEQAEREERAGMRFRPLKSFDRVCLAPGREDGAMEPLGAMELGGMGPWGAGRGLGGAL